VTPKVRTWIACGSVAAGAVAAGALVDAARGRRARASVVAGALGVLYLAGTLAPRSRLFGRPARPARSDRVFALTFDDGPDPRHTPAISRMLAERGHRATFFVLGRAVREHPDIAAAVVADGHELACHGDDHRLLAFASPRAVRAQLRTTEEAVRAATGVLPARLFRAPHGVRSPWLTSTLRRAGYRLCAWDGTIFDTAEPGVDAIVQRVSRVLGKGRIVLLHDGDATAGGASRRQTVAALPRILDEAERRGLCSVHLSTLVGEPAAADAAGDENGGRERGQREDDGGDAHAGEPGDRSVAEARKRP
jgi:peptidoglycan/xylan/chitin deacetylase (PgdA/CDA1 family)